MFVCVCVCLTLCELKWYLFFVCCRAYTLSNDTTYKPLFPFLFSWVLFHLLLLLVVFLRFAILILCDCIVCTMHSTGSYSYGHVIQNTKYIYLLNSNGLRSSHRQRETFPSNTTKGFWVLTLFLFGAFFLQFIYLCFALSVTPYVFAVVLASLR